MSHYYVRQAVITSFGGSIIQHVFTACASRVIFAAQICSLKRWHRHCCFYNQQKYYKWSTSPALMAMVAPSHSIVCSVKSNLTPKSDKISLPIIMSNAPKSFTRCMSHWMAWSRWNSGRANTQVQVPVVSSVPPGVLHMISGLLALCSFLNF